MADEPIRIGLDGKFLWGAAGSTPSTECKDVEDVTLGISGQEAEAIIRGKTFAHSQVTVNKATLSFKLYDRKASGLLTALRTAALARTAIAMYAKDASDGEGLDGDWNITGLNRTETNPEFTAYSVEAKLNILLRDGVWA